MFDLNPWFVAAFSDHFVASRRASAARYRLGRPGPLPAMIARCAAALRRAAAALDAWAAGSPAELPDPFPLGGRGAR
ncbi:hypothetical protein [Tepidiforma thermophila]|jgi:hypothetical protein|uniref:Uncharacterized protein n=1 Tax=Tepidiforma thermophila (strain KCTC 52669 / CGMCC 1.13589 / G233) TaxID=2761530 RepID=A0A2A9HCI8_TEPT2|nr:hypothetical protein [Tepidiforma thermophila]PFG72872.1 hypothetical protein A9A59_0065 [Tepidiforma thermophila]